MTKPALEIEAAEMLCDLLNEIDREYYKELQKEFEDKDDIEQTEFSFGLQTGISIVKELIRKLLYPQDTIPF